MWLIILITLVIGGFAEACLGRASRAYWIDTLSEQNRRFYHVSKWLTLAVVIAFLGVQIYFQGMLMVLATLLQLVGGAYIAQRLIARSFMSNGVRQMLALVAGPVCLSLLWLVVRIYQ